MNILLIRNDKLGDFMLAYPAIELLKKSYPDIHICVLVPEYTKELAQRNPYIDKVIVDSGKQSSLKKYCQLLRLVRDKHFDAVITLFSTTRIGWLLFLARITYRLAPATKFAQIFYNHRLTQRRSRSLKSEYEYNLDLARQFLIDHGVSEIKEPEAPYLQFENNEVVESRKHFCHTNSISESSKLVFIHAGSGGSANHISLEQYAQLAKLLTEASSCKIVLTIGPGEEEINSALSEMLHDAKVDHVLHYSKQGLINFAKHIAFADIFIAGSTGPLHIAGALNVPTAGFYTRRRSATPLRWQTLNTPDRRLSFTPPESADEMDMSALDINAAAQTILEKYFTD